MERAIPLVSALREVDYHRAMLRDQRAFAMDMAMGLLTRGAAP